MSTSQARTTDNNNGEPTKELPMSKRDVEQCHMAWYQCRLVNKRVKQHAVLNPKT